MNGNLICAYRIDASANPSVQSKHTDLRAHFTKPPGVAVTTAGILGKERARKLGLRLVRGTLSSRSGYRQPRDTRPCKDPCPWGFPSPITSSAGAD